MLRKIRENRFLPLALLTLLILVLLFLPLGFFLPGTGGWFFGSEGDWFSQHVAIADSLRKAMLSGHEILPQWIGLGGGSNIYDFAYYGLLRPDILASCLIPDVEMKYVIASYAALGVMCSGWFCYIWLQKCGKTRWISFAGAALLVSATCFYHAHHQIMFVNYMPFLILALIGVDKAVEQGKISLLSVSVFLIILHSFYYAPACICVLGIYALHRVMETGRARKAEQQIGESDQTEAGAQQTACRKQTEMKNLRAAGLLRIILAIGLGVGMAMILLLPVGMDILSTAKDGGSAAGKTLEVLDLSLNGLLYNSYGCGMTLITLYTLLLAVRKKENRFLAVALLIAMLVPAVSLILNGFLYARAKILIPFVPLLVWVCIDTLQKLWEGRRRAEWIPLVICLAVALFSDWKALILADGVVLAIWIAYCRMWNAEAWNAEAWNAEAWNAEAWDVEAAKNVDAAGEPELTKKAAVESNLKYKGKMRGGFWLILLVPICVSLGTNLSDSYLHDFYQNTGQKMGMRVREAYIHAEDERQNQIPADQIREFASDPNYRMEILADSFVNCNVLPDGKLQRTSMYSSISDGTYSEFYYDTMRNAISFNNRVALVAGKNPFFNEFMGVRYVLAKKDKVPFDYQVKEAYGDYVLAECEDVLPVCYGMTELLDRSDFDKLKFPDTLEALGTRTIVETDGRQMSQAGRVGTENEAGATREEDEAGDTKEEFRGHFQKQDVKTFFLEETRPKEQQPKEQQSKEQQPENGKSGMTEKQLSGAGDGKKCSMKLSEPLQNQIVVMRFHVNRKDGKEVVISVNGIKNKLSAASAPYPNQNEEFTYIFDSGAYMDEFEVKKSAGNYEVENLEIYTLDRAYLRHENVVQMQQEDPGKQTDADGALKSSGQQRGVTVSQKNTGQQKGVTVSQKSAGQQKGVAVSQKNTGKQVFRGNLTMEQGGYFVTSYPYRAGYEIFVDGVKTESEVVNTTFLGCAVTAGSHTIEIRFTAPGYEAGRWISIIAMVIWGAVLLCEILRDRKKAEKITREIVSGEVG